MSNVLAVSVAMTIVMVVMNLKEENLAESQLGMSRPRHLRGVYGATH